MKEAGPGGFESTAVPYWARTYRRLRESSGASIPVIARLSETASPMGISSCRGLRGKPWRCAEEACARANWRKNHVARGSFGVWKTAETVSGPPRARRGQDCSQAAQVGRSRKTDELENPGSQEVDNARAIQRGERQVDKYSKELEEVTDKEWRADVDTYKR